MESQTIPHRNEGMHLRLEKASHLGDLEELRRLLQEDGLLLHRPSTLHPADSPLHIAAALGHAHFAKDILLRKPDFALGFNFQGYTALHLACANGHLLVVRELLQSNVGVEICCLRDRYGLLPIHTTALKGNVPVLEELLSACSDDVVRGLTCLGDSILHLAVKSNCYEAVKILVERLESNHELLSMRDAKGNTMLHLATARKQLQTVKFLLGKAWIDVNAINKKGCTVLDVLLESPSEHGDLLLGEMIRASGGTTTETIQPVETFEPSGQAGISSNPTIMFCINRKALKRLLLRFFPSSSFKGHDEFKETQNTLMVVATLIATVTFQGGLNPPGGFAQYDDTGKRQYEYGDALRPGQALMADNLSAFLLFDMIALLSSLSIILLMICGCPQWKYMISISMAITWIAVFSTGLAFFFAVLLIFPSFNLSGKIDVLFITWYSIMNVFISYKLIRLHIFMHGKISRYIKNVRTRRDVRAGCFLLCMNHPLCLLLVRIFMVISCFAICGFVALCGFAFLNVIRMS